MNCDLMFSSKSNEWDTPQKLFDQLNSEFNFTLDPCATPENAKCSKFFTKADNGLAQSWENERVFCNPPYGREIKAWVKKAAMQKKGLVVLLIPARTDTSYFHDFIYGKSEIRFLKGRLKFGNSRNGAPFPSMIVVFRHEP